MKLEINMRPFPAVRSNKNSWSEGTKAYHEKMNTLRGLIGGHIYKVIDIMIEDNYKVEFIIKMPKSFSKKKQEILLGEMHKAKPDTDNLLKAFKDSVFYQKQDVNDSMVSTSNAVKKRGNEDKIIFYNLY